MDIYVVTPGDTIDSIARAFGTSADSVIYDNQLVYPYALAVGQALLITYPGVSPSPPSKPADTPTPISAHGFLLRLCPS